MRRAGRLLLIACVAMVFAAGEGGIAAAAKKKRARSLDPADTELVDIAPPEAEALDRRRQEEAEAAARKAEEARKAAEAGDKDAAERGAVPPRAEGTPKAAEPAPQKAEDTPKAAKPAPQKAEDTPKAAEPAPHKAEDTPKAAEPAPQKAEGTPKAAEPAPQKAEDTPKAAEPAPHKAEDTPKAAEPAPQKAEDTPKAAEPAPHKAEDTPKAAEPAPQKAEDTPKAAEPAPGSQESPPLPLKHPYELVRALELVQNRIPFGDRHAHARQREIIREIAAQLASAPLGVWREPRNARAAVTYVLSGGDPRILHRLMEAKELSGGVTKDLLKGLLDYSRGRSKDALERLEKVRPEALGPAAGGHLALAQATLTAADPAKSIGYLDQARLVAPGSLVEEAALRRAVILAARMGDFDKFLLASSQYLRRFPKSVYASNFLISFGSALATAQFGRDPKQAERLIGMLDTLPSEQRKTAYLVLAEEAIQSGLVDLTTVAARKLAELVKGDPVLTARAHLYEAAALVVTDEYDKAVAMLKGIDKAKLGSRDRAVLIAALALAERVREPVTVTPAETPPASAAQGKDGDMPESSAVLAGRKAIAAADKLLKGSTK